VLQQFSKKYNKRNLESVVSILTRFACKRSNNCTPSGSLFSQFRSSRYIVHKSLANDSFFLNGNDKVSSCDKI